MVKLDNTVVKFDDTVVKTVVERIVVKNAVKTVEDIIFELIRTNPEASTPEMSDATSLTLRGIEYQLNKLKNSGKIERVGPANGGYWRILDFSIDNT